MMETRWRTDASLRVKSLAQNPTHSESLIIAEILVLVEKIGRQGALTWGQGLGPAVSLTCAWRVISEA